MFGSALLVAARAVMVLGAVWLTVPCLARRSAAIRAAVWTAAFLALVSLPLLAALAPSWSLPILPGETAVAMPHASPGAPAPLTLSVASTPPVQAVGDGSKASTTPPPESMPAKTARPEAGAHLHAAGRPVQELAAILAVAVWAIGAAVLLTRLLAAHLRLKRLVLGTDPAKVVLPDRAWRILMDTTRAQLGIRRPVDVRLTDAVSMPAVAGLVRPVLLLPVDAAEWAAETRAVVALHELAHVARWDAFGSLVGQLACAIYWFLPPVWLGAKRAATLRERATDDVVLNAGIRPSTYAASLIDLAQRCAVGDSFIASVAMATREHVRERVVAILDGSAARRQLTRRGALTVAAISVAVTAAVGAAVPVAAQASAGSVATAVASPPAAVLMPIADQARPTPPTPPALPSPPAPPAPPTPAAPTALCGPETESSSTSINDDDGRRTWTMKVRGRDCDVDLHAEGKITFTDDFTDIVSLSSDGSFRLRTLRDGVRHELTITERGGHLDRSFKVNDRDHPYDAEARQWFAAFLVDLDRLTGVGVDTRLPALLRRGGVAAVLKETALMPNDYPRSVYYTKLAAAATLTPAEIVTILDQTATLTRSDYYSAEVLKGLASQHTADPGVHAAALRLIGTMKSDYYIVESVKGLVVAGRATPADIEFLFRVAPRLSSDYYKLELVNNVTSGQLDDAERADLARITTSMKDDYYIDEAIKKLGAERGLSLASRHALLDAVEHMRSDYYKADAMTTLLHDRSLSEGDLLDFVETTQRLSSDVYKAEALKAILRHPSATSRVNRAVLDAADTLSSSYYRDDVRRAARDR